MRGNRSVVERLTVHSPRDLASYIDHTLLKPEATEKDIEALCAEARVHTFKAVCVNPVHVKRAGECVEGSDVLVASVIGFPLGASLSRLKAAEAEAAVRDGASEIDMVMRLDLAKVSLWKLVEADIAEVVRAVPGIVVKVILETGMLTRDQIIEACRASDLAGAAFVKTATGFLGRGASVEDVALMRESCSPDMEIKASGGVKTFAQAQALIAAGASRIGTSSGVALVTGTDAKTSY